MDEMLRTVRVFQRHINNYNAEAAIEKQTLIPLEIEEVSLTGPLDNCVSVDSLHDDFAKLEKQLSTMLPHQDILTRNHTQLLQFKHTIHFVQSRSAKMQDESLFASDDAEGSELYQLKFNSVSGIIPRSKWPAFERMLFRITRGNLFMNYEELPDPIMDLHTGEMVFKNAFIVYLHTGSAIRAKIRKSCESFTADIYPVPETDSDKKALLDQINTRISETRILLDRGWDQRYQLLKSISESLPHWTKLICKEKAIYHTMNKTNYDKGRKCMIAECWCPQSQIEELQDALEQGRLKSGGLVPSVLSIIPTTVVPPTYFKTNKFTEAFQGMVNSYGTARYQEINPAVFTIVTFPFEFGIMFGDVGHGFMLFVIALYLLYEERQQEKRKTPMNEMLEMVYSGRYMVLLMSLFSIYIGALYNEAFSIPMNFGSNWMFPENQTHSSTFVPVDRNWTYPFGVDPIWKGASNELLFYNSLKMKTSIIVGIAQMVLGLFMHFLNAVHFRHYYDIFFEFLPRIFFLLSTFGYLVFMIFYKWNTNYEEIGASFAPSLLNELIYMFLPGPEKVHPLYPQQVVVEGILVVIALITVPIMFLPKPILLLLDYKARMKGYTSCWSWSRRSSLRVPTPLWDERDDTELIQLSNPKEEVDSEEYYMSSDEESLETVTNTKEVAEDAPVALDGLHGEEEEEHEEFDFSEAMVHQGLETIEFVLGSISHTASYLRLWALSLAHSELSTVFWEKGFFLFWEASTGSNFIVTGLMTFVAFSVWFMVTVLVIMGMESLSAFLHALRLHWVEFQSKFYRGDGYPFIPFSFKTLDEDE
eukprot:TRINITY_DN9314_c0_g1_i1.p1 TRINITY_DN9314_c0_g1~~TRINITY_DN9314_c0_g1_i1.p1  ORF type:complete len:878 (-),score=144.34 TRINITY_DN9314_c0_g1_i1:15-2459(-)